MLPGLGHPEQFFRGRRGFFAGRKRYVQKQSQERGWIVGEGLVGEDSTNFANIIEHLLCAGTVLDTGDTVVNKAAQHCPHEAYLLGVKKKQAN